MGGCRCTYRNCTMRTDGTTHMFHYPVFDKLRCHQWLTNAQKHEFLNLKVSQLKNRVVCQHHFKDEYFMNFKKDKLTFKAVPTLNGPFCDPPGEDNAITQDEIKVYPISLDDIETEYLSLHDKKANFSVKYGDFLTNSEVMDMHVVDVKGNSNKKTQNLTKVKLKGIKNEEQPCHVQLSGNLNTETLQNSLTGNLLPNLVTNMVIHNQPQLTSSGYILLEPTTVNVEFEKSYSNHQNPGDKTSINNNNNVLQICNEQDKTSHSENKTVPQESKIKIISQKNISEPLPLTGQFTPISPSLILRWPDKRNNTIKTNIDTNVNEKDENKSSYYINILDNNTVNVSPSDKVANIDNKKLLNKSSIQTAQKMLKNTVNTISSNKSLLKPKVTQDRVAEIEEKRKFNMKLKDIIESCFDKTDVENSVVKKNETSNSKNQQVGKFLSKETELPSAHEYTIASIEARMKRMEDVLLKKIDQNTRRIVDLKNTIITSEKKSVCTQTTSNEESQKKHLYKEISKYLSANANSLIYEELFINKYAQSNSQNKPSPKKRRKR